MEMIRLNQILDYARTLGYDLQLVDTRDYETGADINYLLLVDGDYEVADVSLFKGEFLYCRTVDSYDLLNMPHISIQLEAYVQKLGIETPVIIYDTEVEDYVIPSHLITGGFVIFERIADKPRIITEDMLDEIRKF